MHVSLWFRPETGLFGRLKACCIFDETSDPTGSDFGEKFASRSGEENFKHVSCPFHRHARRFSQQNACVLSRKQAYFPARDESWSRSGSSFGFVLCAFFLSMSTNIKIYCNRGQILCSLGDELSQQLPQCLPIFLDRLRNEITRLTTVKAYSSHCWVCSGMLSCALFWTTRKAVYTRGSWCFSSCRFFTRAGKVKRGTR